MVKVEGGGASRLPRSRPRGVRRGTHTQLIAYHTIGVWGAGSDDVGLIQSTKTPKRTKGAKLQMAVTPQHLVCIK